MPPENWFQQIVSSAYSFCVGAEIEFNYSCNSSLVSRIVSELAGDGILLKNKNTYSISVEWIQRLEQFIKRLPEQHAEIRA